ncbi:MAG: cadmium-translocating P-type ATPase [Oscillospiraceae bacterium]|nr:cadmium-translocating P-type ATPase [Oscillospiraceae bacterium]
MNKKQKRMARRIGVGLGFFAAGLILKCFLPVAGEVLLTAAWFAAGREVLTDALEKIRGGKPFDEDFLMTVASVCALLLGEFVEAAAVMLFFQVGELFESIAVERSRKSVAALMDLRPDVAYILREGEWEESAPEDVAVGDLIRVNPGERIPVDGVIVEGAASVDTSKITGESVPADLAAGDPVLSGCINLSGVLTIRAESEFASSTVARILDLMDSASEGRSHTENLITRFAQVYTPCVVYAALALALIPPLFTGFHFATWVHRALNFLVVSCPCALVISVPLAYFGGMGAVSRAGMIAKGGIALESLARVDTFVFDKTGTLTTGDFRVVKVESQRSDLLELVAAAEQASHHPIAKAIVREAKAQLDASDIREIPGQGIFARVGGHDVHAGNLRMVHALGLTAPEVEGSTMVYAVVDGEYAGAIVLEDTVKAGARESIQALHDLGVRHTCMLTGDREAAARIAAGTLGMTDYRAGLLPQDKLTEVEKLLDSGAKVAFVGDGVNDAPVLSAAHVGVAMGGVGSDAAVEASDLVLLKDDLAGLPKAVKIARRTVAIAKQNIAFALIIKFGVMLLSIPGIANMWMAVFADVGVAMLCILNSFRALKSDV